MDLRAGASGSRRSATGENGVGNQQNFEKASSPRKLTTGAPPPPASRKSSGPGENTPSSQLKTIERSVATNYFDNPYGGNTTGRLGFGNRHVGLYWSGLVPQVDGCITGVAITNGIQSVTNYGNAGRGRDQLQPVRLLGNVGYGSKFAGLTYKVGVNVGYAGDANSEPGAAGVPPEQLHLGLQSLRTLAYSDFTLAAEFLQARVQNGRLSGAGAGTAYSNASPYGINLTPSYKINDQWEIAAKYSYWNQRPRHHHQPGCPQRQQRLRTENFNRAWEGYLGVNYYIIGTT